MGVPEIVAWAEMLAAGIAADLAAAPAVAPARRRAALP